MSILNLVIKTAAVVATVAGVAYARKKVSEKRAEAVAEAAAKPFIKAVQERAKERAQEVKEFKRETRKPAEVTKNTGRSYDHVKPRQDADERRAKEYAEVFSRVYDEMSDEEKAEANKTMSDEEYRASIRKIGDLYVQDYADVLDVFGDRMSVIENGSIRDKIDFLKEVIKSEELSDRLKEIFSIALIYDIEEMKPENLEDKKLLSYFKAAVIVSKAAE